MMINSDYVLDYARPMPPSFINVGGIQVNKRLLTHPICNMLFVIPTLFPPLSFLRIREFYVNYPDSL